MKPQCEAEAESRLKMPPTRGHDLKLFYHHLSGHGQKRCPPHGGTT